VYSYIPNPPTLFCKSAEMIAVFAWPIISGIALSFLLPDGFFIYKVQVILIAVCIGMMQFCKPGVVVPTCGECGRANTCCSRKQAGEVVVEGEQK